MDEGAGGSTEEQTARSSAKLTSRHQRPPLAAKADDDEDDCAVSIDTAESHRTLQGRWTSFRSRSLSLLLLNVLHQNFHIATDEGCGMLVNKNTFESDMEARVLAVGE